MTTSGLRRTVIHAEIDTTNCYSELRLNGIPVCPNTELLASPFTQSIQVNSIVVPNLNVLELAVDIDVRGPSYNVVPKEKRAPDGATAIGRLVRYDFDRSGFASPEFGEVLAEIKWSAADDVFATSPRELRAFAQLGDEYGRRVWQDAPQLTLDEETQNEALQLLETIRSAFRRGDSAALIDMFSVRARDVVVAYNGLLNYEKEHAGFLNFIATMSSDPDRVPPIDLDSLDFRLVAERRILVPHTKSFASALRVTMDVTQDGEFKEKMTVPYDVKFARINGRLCIV